MDDIKDAFYLYSGTNVCNNSYYKQINLNSINDCLCFYAHEDSEIYISLLSGATYYSDTNEYNYIYESSILKFNSQGYDNQYINNYTINDTLVGKFIKKFYLKSSSNEHITLKLSCGDRIYLWLNNTYNSEYNRINITGKGKYSVSGKLISIINNITPLPNNAFKGLFKNNTALYDASGLIMADLITLPNSCYYEMFRGCTQLRYPPKLINNLQSNITVSDSCFAFMFGDCTNLIVTPDIPLNVTLSSSSVESVFQVMFLNCTSITSAPEYLPEFNSTAGNWIYGGMFSGCTNLIVGPKEINYSGENGCSQMFYNCTNLKRAPNLPSRLMNPFCYESMFSNCTSLEEAPILPALELVDGCYTSMFAGCSKLKYIEADFLNYYDSDDNICTNEWLLNVAENGVILLNPNNPWFSDPNNYRSVSEIPVNWYFANINFDYSPYDDMYLTFKALENGVYYTYTGPNNIQYSIDNGKTWKTATAGTQISDVRNYNQTILWKGSNTNTYTIGHFTSNNKKFEAYGNITSLRHSDNFNLYKYTSPYRYTNINNTYGEYGLFANTYIVSAKNLRLLVKPLGDTNYAGEYSYMFQNCTQFKEGPELIHPIVDNDGSQSRPSYQYMFQNCSALTKLYIYILHENGQYNNTFPTLTNVYIYDNPLNRYYWANNSVFATNKLTIHNNLKVIKRNYISVQGTAQSTSSNYIQYIDLNYIPTATTGISITAKCDNTTDRYLIGCRNGTSSNTRFGIGHSAGYYYGWGGYLNSNQTSAYNTTDWRNIKLNYKNDGNFSINSEDEQTTYYTKVISVTTGTTGGSTYPLNFSPSFSLVLFGQRTSATAISYAWAGSIKSVQITEGTEIVMDLEPISIYGAAGFYDKIGKKYYGQKFTNRQYTYNLSNYILEYH